MAAKCFFNGNRHVNCKLDCALFAVNNRAGLELLTPAAIALSGAQMKAKMLSLPEEEQLEMPEEYE
jgi:hypothetical protein